MDTSSIVQLAASDFGVYCALQYPDFECSWHHRLMIDRFEKLEKGTVTRQIISMPRRHGKTLLALLYVAWYLGRHPDRAVIYVTYAADLSESSGRRVRANPTRPA
jgi:hypothetical protein